MKLLVLLAALLLATGSTTTVATNIDQVGSVASGRSTSGTLRLESVLGQSVSSRAGSLTSGFYSQFAVPDYVPGDANGDKKVNISDVVFLINYIFAGGHAPASMASADADCNGMISISDAVRLLNYIFGGGAAPHYCS